MLTRELDKSQKGDGKCGEQQADAKRQLAGKGVKRHAEFVLCHDMVLAWREVSANRAA